MIPFEGNVVIVCFEDGKHGEPAKPVPRILGLVDGDRRCRWHAPGLLSVHADQAVQEKTIEELRALPGVRKVAALPLPQGLIARKEGQPNAAVALPNGFQVGGGSLTVIAGPCSVESRSQICEIAARVKEAGARVLRGGAFKPRTSPYAFGGLGERALENLALARERTGLPVVTEVLTAEDLDLVARYADIIQVGSRNMQNFPLLLKSGAHPAGKPVLLKRSFGATIDEFLQAAEYVLLGRLSSGHEGPGVILCERGIRSFEPSTRFSLDISAVPVLKKRTHLPVIVDPSHSAGVREYVPPLARAAAAAGADGLIIEVHRDPPRAWSDARQCVDLDTFRKLMEDLRRLDSLGLYRRNESGEPDHEAAGAR